MLYPTPRVQQALGLLLQAHEYALDVTSDSWHFAVEQEVLREAGLTNSDLRWLLHKAFVEHAKELTTADDDGRRFQRQRNGLLAAHSCFILTAAGVAFVRSVCLAAAPTEWPEVPTGSAGCASPFPIWDKDRRALRFQGQLVKQFKVPAQNQEIILAAFEEEQWPVRIDDPLSLHAAIDPKRRLHDTINSLNRNQRVKLLRFFGDGSGEAIRWEPLSAGDDADCAYDHTQFDAAPGDPVQTPAAEPGARRAPMKLHHIAPSLPVAEG